MKFKKATDESLSLQADLLPAYVHIERATIRRVMFSGASSGGGGDRACAAILYFFSASVFAGKEPLDKHDSHGISHSYHTRNIFYHFSQLVSMSSEYVLRRR